MRRMVLRAAGAAAVTVLTASTVLLGAPSAVAAEGLSASATSRYVLDTEAEVVHARMSIDLENVSPDKQADGGVYTYYFDAYTIPVPEGIEKVKAVSGDAELDVSLSGTDDPSTQLARIGFPDLRYHQKRSIVLTFDIPGAPPRSDNSTRVGPGYATFVAYGPGDEGHNRVEVLAPSAMSFSSTVDGFTPAGDGDTTTYTATENTFEGGLWAAVSFRDPKQTTERTVEVDDLSLTLESFPDDAKWSAFVADKVTAGLPQLERLVGNPWPGGLQRIREDASPSLRGYDGWFDPTGDEIVVGEQLDDDLIFHELSHAWVSGESFEGRWLYEGLAQAIAERAVKATDGTPRSHSSVSRTSSDAVPLNSWEGDAGSRTADVDSYAYPASYRVMTELLGKLSDEQFAAVVGAAVRGERAYDPAGLVTPSGGRTEWTDWLDLVETRGGVTGAPKVFSEWVLTKSQAKQLAPRAAARTAYADLDRGDGGWLPPEGLRDAMTVWDFDRAKHVRDAVAPLGARAVAVQQAAQRTGLPVPKAVRESYEEASLDDDYADLATSLPAAASTILDVGAARRTAEADHDPLTDLGAGLLGVHERSDRAVAALAAGEVERAGALADDVRDRSGWALPLGLGLVLLVVALVGGAATVVVLVLRRPAPRHAVASVPAPSPVRPAETPEADRPAPVGAHRAPRSGAQESVGHGGRPLG
ncbi:hypothetical protein [Phycicoccus sonneratiae]|uniref:Peptidase M1 membrane alanine aminopeptidase domain-containing protein n=1 Tax=Phycicoccus sonneratiae TaxID=2807628 RepID=A0ABS2CN91_9MICO|nr:hypothetical protein [Phycicoccus sonneraticus]MBM6401303.1 hypothetical protein [Phycicoccus sonneraticus]